MSEEYTMKCLVSSENDQQILHVDVRSCLYPQEVYFGHFRYEELSEECRFVFMNIPHLYVCMQKEGMVYFDDYETVINVCVPIASQIREYSLPLHSRCRSEALNKKIAFYTQQKAKAQDALSQTKETKEQQLRNKKQEHAQSEAEKQSLILMNNHLEQQSKELNDRLTDMRKESDIKMAQIRKHYPNKVYQKYVSTKQLQDMETRRQFWIRDISRCNKREVRKCLNEHTQFDEQTQIVLNRIELLKMLFVEVFPRLETIDLSNNKIRNIEGLTGLIRLQRLNLSQNIIEVINGLQGQVSLKELLLDSNKIRKIENLFHLYNLQILSLHKNEIEIVPDEIAQLSKLSELHLTNNQIRTITARVQQMKSLRIFTVVGNRCYNDKNKSKEVINNLIKNGVKTTLADV